MEVQILQGTAVVTCEQGFVDSRDNYSAGEAYPFLIGQGSLETNPTMPTTGLYDHSFSRA